MPKPVGGIALSWTLVSFIGQLKYYEPNHRNPSAPGI